MTLFDPGDVVLVRFPFTDLSATKKRPAVIVSPPELARRHGDVVVVALTSRPQQDPELSLLEWRAAGLPKETWLKPLIGTISSRLVERRLGKLAKSDCERLSILLGRMIEAGFRS